MRYIKKKNEKVIYGIECLGCLGINISIGVHIGSSFMSYLWAQAPPAKSAKSRDWLWAKKSAVL